MNKKEENPVGISCICCSPLGPNKAKMINTGPLSKSSKLYGIRLRGNANSLDIWWVTNTAFRVAPKLGGGQLYDTRNENLKRVEAILTRLEESRDTVDLCQRAGRKES